jgi:predicted AlkP superfamily pyrophosphatase or phosphodiesterase
MTVLKHTAIRRSLLGALLLLAVTGLFAQQPRLVVGIVVDQMRYDYLYRYAADYGEGGFKRFLREGVSCENTHYDYVPTYTAPGHACVYTGTHPALNGIIANEWFDPQLGKHRYVTADARYRTVGATGKVGQHSPAVLLSTTITDELRMAHNFRSKVVGVCLKDRGSILPAGHIPNGCYWFDDASGNFITSTYYPDSLGLPAWVQQFNAQKRPETYATRVWDKLPGVTYSESFTDWGGRFDQGKYTTTFLGSIGLPHDLAPLRKKAGLGVLRFTPFGNSLTLDFALDAIEQMQLGTDEDPDFLCLSFSATDYCAHQFGVHAIETEDIYLRLDADLARLFDYLDKKVGRDNVVLFLTADHGGGETPAHQQALNIPAGVYAESKLDSTLNALINRTLLPGGAKTRDFIHEVSNQQVWFDRAVLDSVKVPLDAVIRLTTNYLRKQTGVYAAFSQQELMQLPDDYPYVSLLRKGIHPRRSGDVLFQLDPGWHPDDVAFGAGGATHGSPYAYDTHVPLLWYGNGIRAGARTYRATTVSDIAPTLAALLRINEPNASTGRVLEEVLKD